MKISEIENRPYQWRGKDGGWQVGKPLLGDGKIVKRCRRGWIDEVLMQPSHASPPTWVRIDDLQPYPAEPIEEPIVKGGE